ncbi:ParB/RepB/Spo0J family partition protein [Intestinimonas butyriciproducens]|uniref:ParB/RepB/Spo0J family partition protein n=1 Tax=Intestinimonas butyriciproducens TaxID=1297617 RepID=UPI0018A95CFD|nr:ParB/RepB/Spo0J family partition protein [Intestinimonas butyriciproducens]MDB7816024.1 ParB/RepB/Spo0J family partition protein [Intestinimonas butyriciproducens]MDB7843206.1 ParB/RepB/Spo0J family partition protein [Intestinimonas butyriciproducens]MDB7857046.1 ParB/RepB/Spo0J family partition protein [Intestinimonas butyriciproducens]
MEEGKKTTPAPEEHPPAKTPDGPAVVEQGDNTPAPSGKVIDLSDVRGAGVGQEQAAGSEKEETAAPETVGQKKSRGKSPKSQDHVEPSGKAPAKSKRATPTKGAPSAPSKAGRTKKPPEKPVPAKTEAPPPEPPAPRDASRGEKEEIVYLNLSDLYPFKDHPFGVRDDAEMQGLVESVKTAGVNQPALVRPREGGGYEIIAGHRRQRASELAGFINLPCIVRSMTDDEAVLAMTDDNLRHREKLLPSEKAAALLQQYEAIKHQGARGDDEAAGKLSLESVGQRNGMSVKTVQRYLWLNDLVPDLKKTMDEGKLSFTPAVEISRIRAKHQKYIAVSIEGQQSSPSQGQAKRLRELDKENKLNPDVIDAILSEEKKKEDRDVIITGAELEKYFGKEATPRQMKDQIVALLDEWKEKQPPELGKGDKKVDMEKE